MLQHACMHTCNNITIIYRMLMVVLQYWLPPTKSSASAALKRMGAQPTQIAAETAAAWDPTNPTADMPAGLCCCRRRSWLPPASSEVSRTSAPVYTMNIIMDVWMNGWIKGSHTLSILRWFMFSRNFRNNKAKNIIKVINCNK